MDALKILVVEDDSHVRNLIKTTLKLHNLSYYEANKGEEALNIASSKQVDLVLLDLGLPDMDGLEVIDNIRSWSNMPIIVISAREEEKDKIDALNKGADDYLTKPFSVEEMIARINAIQRRLQYINQKEENTSFENGPLTIDYASNIVYLDNKQLHLTLQEYQLLKLFAKNVGKVLTHSYIIDKIWGGGVDSDIISLRVYMNALRKKLKSDTFMEPLIQTHIGIGYQMIKY